MKRLAFVLIILLVLLQYKLWVGEGSLSEVWRLSRAIALQKEENATLVSRNEALAAEVQDLKQGLDAIEERSRRELGMIRRDETFFQVIEPGYSEAKP